MNYTLNQLNIFVNVADTGSITKAAEQLHLTQPAVSIQLKKFQDQFEVPLTEIIGRKLYVTDFGHEIADAAKDILNQVEAINFKTLAYKGLLTGKLNVSIVSTGKYVMPYFLSDFMNLHPAVELSMDVTNKSTVIESLKANAVDFSLVSVMPETISVQGIDLIKNKLFLVGNTEILYDKKRYPYSIFKQHPLIFREEGSGTRRTIERFLETHDIPLTVKMELTSNEAVKQAVIAGLGYAIMPLIGIRNELMSGDLQLIPLKDFPITSQWSLIWPEGKKHSPVAKAFLEHLQTHKDEIIHQWFEWYEKTDG